MGDLSIKACLREKVGTGSARAVRRSGMVPGIIYSNGKEGITISVSAKDASIICNRFDAKTNIVNIDVGSREYRVLPKQISLHPVTDSIEHVDFIAIDDVDKVKIDIPIRVLGRDKSIEIKRGGVINMAKRFLKCTVRKDSIPEAITIDISEIKMGTPVSLRNIVIPSGVISIHEDLDQTVLKITGKRSVAEETKDGAEKKEEAAATTTKASSAKPAASSNK